MTTMETMIMKTNDNGALAGRPGGEHGEEPAAPSRRQQERRGQRPRPPGSSHRAEPGANSGSNHNYMTFARFETWHVANMLSLQICYNVAIYIMELGI